jgi:N-acetyl-anhydromuramoyl-L-alanine amidase
LPASLKLRLTREGIVEGARFIPSPNCDERPAGCAVDLLVIHAISLPPGKFGGPGIVELFTNRLDTAAHPFYATIRDLRVSAHFVVRRDGELIQFVPCDRRAWHAGESSWKGKDRCNDVSIGIELEGSDEAGFTDAQYGRLAALTRTLKARYRIRDVVGHSDVAPGRKTDPGPQFDWARYRAMVDGTSLRRARKTQRKTKHEAKPRRTRRTLRKNRSRRAKALKPHGLATKK